METFDIVVVIVVLEGRESKERVRRYLSVICMTSFIMAGSCPTVLIMPAPAGPTGQTLLWEVPGFPETLDPHTAFWNDEKWIISNIYETLVSYPLMSTTTDEYVGVLADDWIISSDGLHYTFHLREGIIFHDRNPFNATCVKYNFERLLGIFAESGFAWTFSGHILGGQAIRNATSNYGPGSSEHIGNFTEWRDNSNAIEVLDESTVRFNLETPSSAFLSILATHSASIVSPSYIERKGGLDIGQENIWLKSTACGTGPYTLDSIHPDELIELSRFNDYWNMHFMKAEIPYAGAIETVVIRTVEDRNMRIQNLNTSQSDACDWPKSLADLVHNGAVLDSSGDGTIKSKNPLLKVWADEPTYNVQGMAFNCREYYWPHSEVLENPFYLKGFREAVRYSFNYSGYIEQALYGFGLETRGVIPQEMLGHNINADLNTLDINQAIQSWNNAMLNGLDEVLANNSYTLEFFYNSGNSEREKACQYMKEGIQKILVQEDTVQPSSNLVIEVTAIEWAMLIAPANYSRGNLFFDLSPIYADPDDYISFLYGDLGFLETGCGVDSILTWDEHYLDARIGEAVQESDESLREDLYIEIQDYVDQDTPCIWMAQETNFQVMSAEVYNYWFNPMIQPYFFAYFKEFSPSPSYSIYSMFCIISFSIFLVSFIGIIFLTILIEKDKREEIPQ